MTSPRRTITEVQGRRGAHYEKHGEDDYAHAEALDLLANDILRKLIRSLASSRDGYIPIKELLPDFKPSTLADDYHSGFDDEYIDFAPSSLEPPDDDDLELDSDW